MMISEGYISRTWYLALVNDDNQPDPYDGVVRVVDPNGVELVQYAPADYLEHFAEHVEPWTYLKFPYLKQLGWQGISEKAAGSIVRTGPLGRLNAVDGMQTPLAQAEYERFFATFGGKPVHNTLAYHWARLIEMLQSAELVVRYAADPRLTDDPVRTLPGKARRARGSDASRRRAACSRTTTSPTRTASSSGST